MRKNEKIEGSISEGFEKWPIISCSKYCTAVNRKEGLQTRGINTLSISDLYAAYKFCQEYNEKNWSKILSSNGKIGYTDKIINGIENEIHKRIKKLIKT